MTQWYAVIDRVTGAAVSFGTVLGELGAGFEAVEITAQPSKRAGTRWDAMTRAVVEIPAARAEPPVDRVGELLADPVVKAALEELSTAARLALSEKLRGKFG